MWLNFVQLLSPIVCWWLAIKPCCIWAKKVKSKTVPRFKKVLKHNVSLPLYTKTKTKLLLVKLQICILACDQLTAVIIGPGVYLTFTLFQVFDKLQSLL